MIPVRRPDLTDASTGDLVMGVARDLRRTYAQALAPWDVTPGQTRALGTICHHGPIRLSALAEHLVIVPRSATQVVDALEERGLIERQPDPTDRRATTVVATVEGRRLHEQLHRARDEASRTHFASLSDEDRGKLERILRQLLA
ncbi:MAG: MarR family winged helix-turn-helix transcriptional regulator [Solirubrobacteraceae bacterium]